MCVILGTLERILCVILGRIVYQPHACIFMGKLEQELLESAQLHPLIWLRYIDDVLLIWIHGEATLNIFYTI